MVVVGVDVEKDGAREWCFWGRNFEYREYLLVICLVRGFAKFSL